LCETLRDVGRAPILSCAELAVDAIGRTLIVGLQVKLGKHLPKSFFYCHATENLLAGKINVGQWRRVAGNTLSSLVVEVIMAPATTERDGE
jgi:hypothetical protein